MAIRAIALLLVLLLAGCLKPVLPTGSTRLGTGAIAGASLELYRVPLKVTLGSRQTQMLPVGWAKVRLTVSGGTLKVAQSYLHDPGTPNPTTITPPTDTFRLPLNATLDLTAELQTAVGAPVALGKTTFTTPGSPGLASATVTVFPLQVALTSMHPTIGRPGQTVTLEGHFPGGTLAGYSVGMPGGAATLTAVSSRSLQVTVPAGGGQGPVTVTYGGTLNGPAFRSTTFGLGLQSFGPHGDQTSLRPFTGLQTSRAEYTLTVVGPWAYAVGGTDNAGVALGSVERAPIHADGTLGRFEVLAGVNLVSPRREHATVRIGSRLYVIGGNAAGSPLSTNTIESIEIDAAGNLIGTFAAEANGLVVPRFGIGTAVVGPYLYVLGGNTGGSASDVVERAMIHADGKLGSFQNLSPGIRLATARHAAAYAVSGETLYVMGGWDGTSAVDTVEKAQITPDGGLDTGTVSTAFTGSGTPLLGRARYAAACLVIGDRLYLIGGNDGGGYTDSIDSVLLQTDGTMTGAFGSTGVFLTIARRAPAAVQVGNSVYVIGGFVSGVATNTAEAAGLNNTMAIGSFGANGALQTARYGHSASVARRHLYVIGGYNGTPLASIEVAPINENHTLGAMAPATSSLSVGRAHHSSVVIRDKLYVIGGLTSAGATNSVEGFFLNPDGSQGAALGAPPALQAARYAHATFILGNYLYVLGGRDSSAAVASMERAAINPDGTLGAFQTTGAGMYSLTSPREYFGCVVLRDKLYAIGGTGQTTIEMAPIGTDGGLAGGFTAIGQTLTPNRESFTLAVVGSSVNVVSGNDGATQGDVRRAGFDATGAISNNFSTLSGATMLAREDHVSVVIGNYLYVLGGKDGAGVAMSSIERVTLQ